MRDTRGQREERENTSATRRQALTTITGAAVMGLAGCSQLTSHEFSAGKVVLPKKARTEIVLAEIASGSKTVTRTPSVGDVEGEVKITSYTAGYARGPARDKLTLVEKFMERVNGTEGAGAGVVAILGDLGIEQLFPGGPPKYSGQQFSLVTPAGAGGENALPIPSSVMLLGKVSNPSPIQTAVTKEAENPRTYAVDAKHFFPGLVYDHGQKFDPMQEWMPAGDYPAPDNFLAEGTVVVLLGDNSPEEVFGVSAEQMPGTQLEPGESLQPFNPFLIATPGNVIYEEAPFTAQDVYEAGVPTWMGGATYGLSVLSTPAGEVAGQPVNPVAEMGFEELLTSDLARELLKQAGVIEADSVEWLAGPSPVSDVPVGTAIMNPSPVQASILAQETPLKSFLGMVSGSDYPWLVGIHMARVENERDNGTDIVVAAAVYRSPLPELADYNWENWFEGRTNKRFTGILGSILIEARSLTASAGQRLRPTDEY